jgi:2-C-methyl-D-erythritol 4-phosphate cytidylyltransferase
MRLAGQPRHERHQEAARVAGQSLREKQPTPGEASAPSVAVVALPFEIPRCARPPFLFDIAGQALLAWSLDILLRLPSVSSVLLVVPASHLRRVQRVIASRGWLNLSVTALPTYGADTCLAWLHAALDGLPAHVTTIALHDVANPIIGESFWQSALAAVDEHTCVVAGHPVRDTIKLTRSDGTVEETPDRSCLRSAQTPLLIPRVLLASALAVYTSEQERPPVPSTYLLGALLTACVAEPTLTVQVLPADPASLPARCAADRAILGPHLGALALSHRA